MLLEINYLFDIRISIDVFKLDFQIKKKWEMIEWEQSNNL